MNIEKMHIGIDLGLQAINSNIYGRLQHEEKDYFINSITQEFVKAVLTKETNTIFNLISYADIRKYYEALQAYVQRVQLEKLEELGQGYAYGTLPTNSGNILLDSATSILKEGVIYKVKTPGTVDLSEYGYKASPPVSGDVFTCKLGSLTGVGFSTIEGEKYRILNADTADFTNVGAENNLPGTVFIATGTTPTDPSTASTELKYLWRQVDLATPVSTLLPITNLKYYLDIDTRSTVKKGQSITSGTLIKGKNYLVLTPGTTNLSGVGGWANPDENSIFTCTSSDTISWSGGTALVLADDVVNRLVKVQDIENFKSHSFGSVITSPIASIEQNMVKVHHDDKFEIFRIILTYINTPVEVDYNAEIDSDLPESLHGYIVDLTVKKISAMAGTQQYPTIRQEIIDESGNMQTPKTQQ